MSVVIKHQFVIGLPNCYGPSGCLEWGLDTGTGLSGKVTGEQLDPNSVVAGGLDQVNCFCGKSVQGELHLSVWVVRT